MNLGAWYGVRSEQSSKWFKMYDQTDVPRPENRLRWPTVCAARQVPMVARAVASSVRGSKLFAVGMT